MKNKNLKISGMGCLLAAIFSLWMWKIPDNTDWSLLMKENVEALTASENNNPYDLCQKAGGFCWTSDVRINHISLLE